jgi:hypothetical protein
LVVPNRVPGPQPVDVGGAAARFDMQNYWAVVDRQAGLMYVEVDDFARVHSPDLDALAGDLDRALHADDPVHARRAGSA